MKLGTLDDGTRDGQLIVVSRDSQRAHLATDIAPRSQSVLDAWPFLAPAQPTSIMSSYCDVLDKPLCPNAFGMIP